MGGTTLPRRVLVPLLAVAMFLLAGSGCAYRKPGIAWELSPDGKQPKARTVAELSERYDSEHCGDCHEGVYKEWKNSIHSRSMFGTGRTTGSLVTTVTNGLMEWDYSGVRETRDVKLEQFMGCAKCHLPQLAEATEDVAREIAGDIFRWAEATEDNDVKTVRQVEAKIKSLNIGCLVCHNRSAIVHKWADGYPLPGTVYGKNDGAHFCGSYTKMKRSPVIGESIFCGQCHGQGPNFEFDNPTQCATAYSSYLFSYRANGGREECQDCHMRKFRQGHDIGSYRDPRMVKAAVDFSLVAAASRVRDGERETPGVVARVTVTNRAGHGIPDG